MAVPETVADVRAPPLTPDRHDLRAQPPGVDIALMLALTGVAIALFTQATLVVDSGRDLAWGWSIATGAEYPATGPSLNGLWRPGPLWYWLLGVLLWLTHSVGLTASLVGVLAAAKIPLAWWFGRRLQGPALGLALAAAIALPGWSTVGQLVLSHTSLVESCVMATLCVSLCAWQQRSPVGVVGASLLLGIAVHAHPTALVAAPAVALVLLHRLRKPSRVLVAIACLAAFALPFAPMLVAEATAGWPQWQASTGYFGASEFAKRGLRAPSVLWGAVVHEVQFLHALMGRTPRLALIVAGTLAVAMALSSIGLLRAWRRPQVIGAVAFALWCWGFVLMLRDITPAWMVYSCAPAGALLVALGWQALWIEHPSVAARALAALSLLAGTMLMFERIATVSAGLQHLPAASITDIAAPVQIDSAPRLWLPAWGHDVAAQRICSQGSPVALHGDLATALNYGQGVAIEMHCGTTPVSLGGAAGRHVVGIPLEVAQRLGIEGEATSWGYLLRDDAMPLYPATGQRVHSHTRYLVDDFLGDFARIAPTTTQIPLACRREDLLVATNLLPQLNSPFDLSGLYAPLAAQAGTHPTRYYTCPDGAASVQVTTRVPSAADVFVLPRD